MTRTPEIAIAMPVYNEEGCIADVVRSWLSILDTAGFFNQTGRLVVVNDGSKDGTGPILDELARKDTRLHVVHQKNGGHGSAVLRAYHECIELGATWIFQVDSDDQFEPSDFFKLWNRRQASHFSLGFRQKRFDALHRLVITRMVRMSLFVMFGVWLWDSNIPFRLFSAVWLRKALNLVPESVFAPNIFLTVLGAASDQNLGFIPIEHRDRRTGVVSIIKWKLVKVLWQGLKELFMFRLNLPTTKILLDLAILPLPGAAKPQEAPDKIA